ncbi:GNAT family N-acetyltransferase [Mycolicibacterium litorale]|nr:GNAT family N-acetyltransferase [Mycolicibacterium litorale]
MSSADPTNPLGANGFDSESVIVIDAADEDADELAAVAAATFPLACPASVAAPDIAAFIAANLSSGRFAEYLADDSRLVLVARHGRRIVGYALLVPGVGDDTDVASAVRIRPAAELSKIYVLPDFHGSGASAMLAGAAISRAAATGARALWLGVNQKNLRAQRFYAKHGFTITGTRTFQLGAHTERDFVLVRPL